MSIFSYTARQRLARVTGLTFMACVAAVTMAGLAATLHQDWPWYGQLAMCAIILGLPALIFAMSFEQP